MPAPKETAATFESALEKLESIVHSMESGQLPLEELLARYEEGTQWIRFCQDKLATAEKRIEVITRSASGKAELADFEPETTVRKNSPSAAPLPAEPDDLLLS
jgi:exodeoxyribonuclease VII small subunit